jgi:hypothetical protein
MVFKTSDLNDFESWKLKYYQSSHIYKYKHFIYNINHRTASKNFVNQTYQLDRRKI